MSATWSEASSEVVARAGRLIKEHHLQLNENGVRIGFIFRSEAASSRGRTILGDISKIGDKLRPVLDYDFIVWISEDDYTGLDEQRRDALIDHQLCHIALSDSGGWTVRGHDIEEFNKIIERYGAWNADLYASQLSFAEGMAQMSLPGLPPKEAVVASIDPTQMDGSANWPMNDGLPSGAQGMG